MSTDRPDPQELLRRRAGRGTPRGAEAVLAAARHDADGPEIPLGAGPSSGRRRATVAAVVLLVAAIAGAAVASRRDGGSTSTGSDPGSALCTALDQRAAVPEGIDPNLVVDVDPGHPEGQAAVDELLRRPAFAALVVATHHVDETASYQNYVRQHRHDPDGPPRLGPDELPTSVEVRLRAGVDRSALVAALRRVPEVFAVHGPGVRAARVLDLLVPAGIGGFAPSGPIDLDLPAFAARWPRLLAAVERAATPEVRADVRLLADRFAELSALGPQPPARPSPEEQRAADRAAAASVRLDQAAARTCGHQAEAGYGDPLVGGD